MRNWRQILSWIKSSDPESYLGYLVQWGGGSYGVVVLEFDHDSGDEEGMDVETSVSAVWCNTKEEAITAAKLYLEGDTDEASKYGIFNHVPKRSCEVVEGYAHQVIR